MPTYVTPSLFTWLVPSQKRIFHADMPTPSIKRLTALRNEPISFSLAYRANAQKAANGRVPDTPISVQVTSDTLPFSVYKVGCVPFAASECEDADRGAIGPCPDILIKKQAAPEIVHLPNERIAPYIERGERQLLNASCVATQSVYITANEQGEVIAAGEHEIQVRVVSLMTGEEIADHRLTVTLIDACLPENDLLYTNWVHYDCLSESHGIPLWSDAYFDLLGKYLTNAAMHGMNTLLTPAFTPALDTPVGTERMNVQLVRVILDDGGYRFDLSLLRRFIRVAKAAGIRCFEHCHLFSQWGAERAINIYGERNGACVRLFGWETPATDPEYAKFLTRYLSAFLGLAKEEGIEDDLLFHISDEPHAQHLESYANALRIIEKPLAGKRLGDALSDYDFYRHGLVKLPIVDMANAKDFDGKCDNMMLYYTGGESQPGMSNRLLTNAPQKIRILGLHLFRYKAKGFLHWGYNYNYGRMSLGLFDPAIDPCFYKNIPGVTYLVYPSANGSPMPSLREKQMCEAMNDYRALRLLESRIGYGAALRICEDVLGKEINYLTIPDSGDAMLALRERINQEIERSGT